MIARLLVLVSFAGLPAAGCSLFGAFACQEDSQCVLDGAAGTCHASGICSYPDPVCASGERFSAHASHLASQCVPVDDDGGPPMTGSATAQDDSEGDGSGEGESTEGSSDCTDGDGDGFGVGPGCAALDCDDDNAMVSSECFYVAPDGNDAGAGTRADPWRTFGRAGEALTAGQSLVLLDGDYRPATNGSLSCQCPGPLCFYGADGAPVSIRAENDRQAVLHAEGAVPAASLDNCDFVQLAGLSLVATEDLAGGNVLFVQAEGVAVRRSLVSESGAGAEFEAAVRAWGATGLLLEDLEVYSPHYGGITVVATQGATLRRVYVNGRDRFPQYGIVVADSADMLIENAVIENFTTGIYVYGSDVEGGGSPGLRVLGSVVYAGTGDGYGAWLWARAPGRLDGARLEHFVTVGTSVGLNLRGPSNAVIDHATFVAPDHAGIFAGGPDQNEFVCDTTLCSMTARHVLVEGPLGAQPQVGFDIDDTEMDAYLIADCNVAEVGAQAPYPAGEAWDDAVGKIRTSTVVDSVGIGSAVGQCRIAVPENSNMKGAASDGADIGADIRWRYVQGVQTPRPLWDPQTGAFPCGSTVAGYNDGDADSCIGVHQPTRLGVVACL